MDKPTEHLRRIEAVARTYPNADGATDDTGQAATAEVFSELSTADFAACRYHQASWAAIGAIARELTTSSHGDVWEALEHSDRERRLSSDEDREWLRSLFLDAICWDDGADSLTSGHHRLCALRAAGVPASPVEGGHLPDTGYPPPRESAEHAAHTVETVLDLQPDRPLRRPAPDPRYREAARPRSAPRRLAARSQARLLLTDGGIGDPLDAMKQRAGPPLP